MNLQQFKQVILPLKNQIFRFAYSYLNNEADAKDVVQEVMMKCWEEIRDPTSIRNIKAWCLTITRNKSLDKLKKKGRNYLPVGEQVQLADKEIGPLQSTEEKESASRIRRIISGLPLNQKEVITLRDIEGYSYKEIAEILGLEEGNIRVLLHRARTKVKKQIIRIHNYGIAQSS